jgi:colanic acid biosynthesis protein WcaH
LDIKNAPYLGLYEHFYDDSVFTDEPNNNGVAVSTHYVVNGFELVLPEAHAELPFEQHNESRWLSEEEFKTSDVVHVNSRWYVDP